MGTNFHAALPRYVQIEESLIQAIGAGVYPSGSQLPPESVLIKNFGASRTTVRKAIENLVLKGVVEIRRGTGTFVSTEKFRHRLNALTGFVEDMEELGHRASARLLGWSTVAASESVAQNLNLAVGTSVVCIHRVRLANGVPVSLDETYLPAELGQKVVTNDLNAEPIFSLLENKYDTPLFEAEYRLEAASASATVAQALQIEQGAPIFLIERTSFTHENRPVDYEKLHYRGDLVQFATRLSRRKSSER